MLLPRTRLLTGLLLAAATFLVSGCYTDMDPFEGGEGVRVNINGSKYIMLGMPGGYYAKIDAKDDVCSFSSSISLTSMVSGYEQDPLLSTALAVETGLNPVLLPLLTILVSTPDPLFQLKFSVQDNDLFEKDRQYSIGIGGDKTAVFVILADDYSSSISVPLSGWISFLNLGSKVEARFELKGELGGKELSLRHGFLRLQQKVDKQ